jgi:hypothetical protein
MASHVHCRVVPNPRMNSSLTSPTNTQIFRARCLKSQPSQRLSHDGDRPSRTNLQDALSTTMSGLPTLTNAPTSMVTRHGISCIQPSATSLSSILFVQEPSLKLLPLDTRHLYSSHAGLPRRSSWPAHVFRSSSKCPIMNCSVFCFHRESHF